MLLNCINAVVERFGAHLGDAHRLELVQLLGRLWSDGTALARWPRALLLPC